MDGAAAKNWDEAIIVALGSNLGGEYGSSRAVLVRALEQFPDIGLTVKAKSSLWRSRAWPDDAKPDYFNAVAIVETASEPRALLRALHVLETRFGRTRTAPNESRVLDLDLIAYGRIVCADVNLILPHPRAADRRFVMGPLSEIAPEWRDPANGASAATLVASAHIGRDAAPFPGAPSALHKSPPAPM